MRFIDCQSNICICHFEAYVFGLFWNLVCPALHFVGLIILLEVFNCFSLFGGRHRLQHIQIHVQLYLLILLKQYRFSVLTLKLYVIQHVNLFTIFEWLAYLYKAKRWFAHSVSLYLTYKLLNLLNSEGGNTGLPIIIT